MSKIIDCITFFDENYIFDFRYKVLKPYVDKFIVCESIFDHKGKKKGVNFKNTFSCDKIKHIVLKEPFPSDNNLWQNQAMQREFILEHLDFASKDDYVFFSDPDEIPNPKTLENFKLDKKYGIFLQKFYNYKFNIYNKYESPWEGTRVSKKKDLKSINYLRQKIKTKNSKYKFYRIDKERSVQIFENAGWHFNNLMSPEKISTKLKTFAHEEFADCNFSSIEVIKEKIYKKVDLFNRNQQYDVVELDSSFPKYLLSNLKKFREFVA